MLRHRAVSSIALILAAGLAVSLGGCKNAAGVLEDKNEGGWFSKPLDIFAKPDWARPVSAKANDLDNGGPVGPDDLVGADGSCSPAAAQAQVPQPTAPAAVPTAPAAVPAAAGSSVGSMAGDLGGEQAPTAPQSPVGQAAPPVLGGIALGMTECQTVQRAGTPGNINISAGDKGERRVVLTYLSGPWPGIYHFDDGRLKEIDRAPEPPAPAKPPPKKKATKKKPASAKTSQRAIEQVR